MKRNIGNKIILLTGRAGSGKTSVANALARKYNLTIVQSYTTREARTPNEKGHIFVTQKEFDELRPSMIAYTRYDNNDYGATKQQVDENDIYIVDINGVNMIRKHYKNKDVVVVYLNVSEETAVARMRKRGDSEEKISKRMAYDCTTCGQMKKPAKTNIIVSVEQISPDYAAELIFDMVECF